MKNYVALAMLASMITASVYAGVNIEVYSGVIVSQGSNNSVSFNMDINRSSSTITKTKPIKEA